MLQLIKRLIATSMSSLGSIDQFLRDDGQDQVKDTAKGSILGNSTKGQHKGQETCSDRKQDSLYLCFIRNDSESLPIHEISFQKNFLAEHIKAAEAIIQNLEEYWPSASKQTGKRSQKAAQMSEALSSFPKDASQFICELVPQCPLMTHTQFIKDLGKQKDLEEFLSYLINKYPPELTISLIIISIDIWSEVRSLNLKEYEIKNFRRLANNFSQAKAESYFQRAEFSPLKALSLRSELTYKSVEILPRFKEVVKRWATTILCIVGGFFENPFAPGDKNAEDQDEVDYPKRQLSSVSIGFLSYQDFISDHDFLSEPEKKVKRQ